MTTNRKRELLLEAINQIYVAEGLMVYVGLGKSPTFYRLSSARRTIQARLKKLKNLSTTDEHG